MNYLEAAEYALNYFKSKNIQAGITGSHIKIVNFNYENRKINVLKTTLENSLNLNVLIDGRIGRLQLNDLTQKGVDQALYAVMESAKKSESDECNSLAAYQEPAHFSHGQSEAELDKMHFRLQEFIAYVENNYNGVRINILTIEHSKTDKIILNTNGVRFMYEKGLYDFSFAGDYLLGGEGSTYNYLISIPISMDKPLIECASTRIVLDYLQKQTKIQPLQQKFTGEILLSPLSFEVWINKLIAPLFGSAIVDKTSIYQNKLNQKIASDLFTLRSVEAHQDLGNRLFLTGDCYKLEDMEVITDGELKNFFIDSYTANKTGLSRTPNNGGLLVVDGGQATIEEMIKSIKKGLLINRIQGGSPSAAGDFSFVAKNSYYIEDGEIKYAIPEAMVTGNTVEMLLNITGLSKEQYECRDMLLPWIKFGDMDISG